MKQLIYSRVKKAEIACWIRDVLCLPIEGEILNTPLYALKLSVRATNTLNRAELKTIADFMLFGPEKLCRVKNMGNKTIYEIGNAIKEVVTAGKNIDREKKFLEHQNAECLKADVTNLTFEEQVNASFDEKLLNTPIEDLNLSVRAINGLKNAGIKIIKDVVDFGLYALQNHKNLDRKTIENIKKAILEVRKTQPDKMRETSFVDAISSIVSSVTPKHLSMLQARFGYDGKCKVLEEIGSDFGITRERVRQIVKKELSIITRHKRKEEMQTLLENLEILLFKYRGVISISDMAKDGYFITGTKEQLRFIINLIVEIYKERYTIVAQSFLTNLSNDEISMFRSNIREIALRCRFPIGEKVLLENIMSVAGPISKDYLSHCLLYHEHVTISNGMILFIGRLSLPEKVRLLLSDVNRPVHFTEIAILYKERYGDSTSKSSTLGHAIHARIGDSKEFIIVGRGTFMLREKFILPKNINEIVETSREILREIKSISDTKYLISELHKRGIDIGDINEYSLKPILLEYSGFIKYRKFEIGLEELEYRCERKPLADLIFVMLSSIAKPMHAKAIWKELQKKRGFPEYAISQRLADDQRFIRVAAATYTISKNIIHYEEKRNIVISFAKEWVTFKMSAISSFLISAVLKEAEKVKDLPLGLVEHFLETSSEFIRLPNGFYNLSENKHDTGN